MSRYFLCFALFFCVYLSFFGGFSENLKIFGRILCDYLVFNLSMAIVGK